jgi:hypothetical protein
VRCPNLFTDNKAKPTRGEEDERTLPDTCRRSAAYRRMPERGWLQLWTSRFDVYGQTPRDVRLTEIGSLSAFGEFLWSARTSRPANLSLADYTLRWIA